MDTDQQQVLCCVQRHQEPELGLLLAPVDPLQGEEREGEPEGGDKVQPPLQVPPLSHQAPTRLGQTEDSVCGN